MPNIHTASFDQFCVVDWSGANTPRHGADSIWIAGTGRESVNPRTRAEAAAILRDRIEATLIAGERLLIGLDFAFGFPAGFARAMGLADWAAVWAYLHEHIEDDETNASNRFAVAARINAALGESDGPFWGYTRRSRIPHGLRATGNRDWTHPFAYRRHAEDRQRRASPVFKLAYTGSVGSQTLLGIARLEALRRDFADHVAVWPFETQFAADLSKPVVLAEIYPSQHAVPEGPDIKDKRQVEAVLRDFEAWNGPELARKLGAPALPDRALADILREEGWVLGL